MARVWTHGVWTVAAGREDDFVAAEPALVRDRERPSEFRSFGAWPDLEAVGHFREEIRPHLSEMDELIERFETFTLDEVYPGG